MEWRDDMLVSILRLTTVSVLILSCCAATVALSGCQQQQIPLIEQHCGTCHSAAVVYQTRRTEEGWRQVMHGMKIRGMVITKEAEEQVFEVLLREYLLK